MSGFWEALGILIVAVNPAVLLATKSEAGTPGSVPRGPGTYAAGWALAVLLGAAAAIGAAGFLRWLEVPVESFRLTPGAVLIVEGLHAVWRARRPGIVLPARGWEWSVHPIALPGLLGPGTLATVLLLSAENSTGPWRTLPAYGLVTAVTAVLAWAVRDALPLWRSLAQLTGALQVSLGVAFVLAGIHAI